MGHNHKSARRHDPQSGHPDGRYYSKKGGGPGRYARGQNATERNKALREKAAAR